MNYVFFGAYSATICAVAGFACGYIWQTLINQEVLNGPNNR